MTDTRYECCGCHADMTDAVKQAFAERTWGVRRVTSALDREDERASVVVTCPKGHTCRYYAV